MSEQAANCMDTGAEVEAILRRCRNKRDKEFCPKYCGFWFICKDF